MREYKCINPNTKVSGFAIQVFVDAFGAYQKRGEKMLARHLGIEVSDFDVNTPQNVQRYLNAMAEIEAQFGEYFLRKMGEKIYEVAPFPPEISDLPQLMSVVNHSYHSSHYDHDNQIGNYLWSYQPPKRGVMRVDVPYPCTFDIGILLGAARRFAPTLKLTHEEAQPCRNRGDSLCEYLLEW